MKCDTLRTSPGSVWLAHSHLHFALHIVIICTIDFSIVGWSAGFRLGTGFSSGTPVAIFHSVRRSVSCCLDREDEI